MELTEKKVNGSSKSSSEKSSKIVSLDNSVSKEKDTSSSSFESFPTVGDKVSEKDAGTQKTASLESSDDHLPLSDSAVDDSELNSSESIVDVAATKVNGNCEKPIFAPTEANETITLDSDDEDSPADAAQYDPINVNGVKDEIMTPTKDKIVDIDSPIEVNDEVAGTQSASVRGAIKIRPMVDLLEKISPIKKASPPPKPVRSGLMSLHRTVGNSGVDSKGKTFKFDSKVDEAGQSTENTKSVEKGTKNMKSLEKETKKNEKDEDSDDREEEKAKESSEDVEEMVDSSSSSDELVEEIGDSSSVGMS